MTYRIRFQNSGSLHDSEPQTLEEARSIAVSLSNWNQRVEIIDTDLLSKEAETPGAAVVQQFKPWSEAAAQALEASTF